MEIQTKENNHAKILQVNFKLKVSAAEYRPMLSRRSVLRKTSQVQWKVWDIE